MKQIEVTHTLSICKVIGSKNTLETSPASRVRYEVLCRGKNVLEHQQGHLRSEKIQPLEVITR